MQNQQPKPDSKKYSDLISEIKNGIIKIPKFQRDFVWGVEKTAKLLDSILKGYPIGTFILWQTDERINEIKDIGDLQLPQTPEGTKVQYVLDGQQRITSLYAAYLGAKINKVGEKKVTDYSKIWVNLDDDIDFDDGQVITAEPAGKVHISLSEVLNYMDHRRDIKKRFTEDQDDKIADYNLAFSTYDFSTVLLRKEDIDSAIEVFTRINTGGQTLTLFEIMSAKTYDEAQNFDMQTKWAGLIKELKDVKFDGISSTMVLSLLSLVLSSTKECKRKTILGLNKQDVIDKWPDVISALRQSIDYFRTVYGIPVSKLLPYDALLVPFGYFFYHNENNPSALQAGYLRELFWKISLSYRYSSSTESKLAQDARRVDLILKNQRPNYDEYNLHLDSPKTLISTSFSAGNSYCKAILCLLAAQGPRNFDDNGRVILDNSWLKAANSKNFHHFFPKSFVKKLKTDLDENSLVNITFVSDSLNKRKIGSRGPSQYIADFASQNPDLDRSLQTHFISQKGFGIESDDYLVFLEQRAKLIYEALLKQLEPSTQQKQPTELESLIAAAESESLEFKSTMRWDVRRGEVNKQLEFDGIARTIAAFLNSDGGNLIIGVDDNGNVLGIENDLNTLKKSNTDGFDLKVSDIIKKHIGSGFASHISTAFHTIEDSVVCQIKVSRSGQPVFATQGNADHFYIRQGASSQLLSRAEQSQYEREHWKS